MRTISNSEVSTFLQCERRHYYAHVLKVKPKMYGTGLTRGIIGHEALAVYYNAMQENTPHSKAVAMALDVVDQYAVTFKYDMEMLAGLRQLLDFYLELHEDDHKQFKILAVEQNKYLPITDDYRYGMKLDLLIQWMVGPYGGEIQIMDHKFSYNFPSPIDLSLNAQIPKYLATVKTNGVDVKRGVLNTLRWRVTKANELNAAERFRRSYISPSNIEIRNIMKEQILASERIVNIEHPELALRTLNKMVCDNCPYSPICKMELVGEDIKLTLDTEYEPNTYGDSYDVEEVSA